MTVHVYYLGLYSNIETGSCCLLLRTWTWIETFKNWANRFKF